MNNQHHTKSNVLQAASDKPAASMNGKEARPMPDNRAATIMQRKQVAGMNNSNGVAIPIQKKENNTGLPDNLKSGMENLSGISMDDVTVHYNSAQPKQLQAHAYAQGTDIHVGPGQEKHLPHEAWHVVQQKQGRVRPTMQLKSKVNINDDKSLETEADLMGAKALSSTPSENGPAATGQPLTDIRVTDNAIQRKIGFEFEMDSIRTRHTNDYYVTRNKTWVQHDAGDRIMQKDGYEITADIADTYSRLEFVTKAFDEVTQLPQLITVIRNMIADVADIRRVSLANKRGYLAGVPYTGAGAQGYMAGDGWVGINKIPRLGGPWYEQMNFAAKNSAVVAGQLQMTSGFNLAAFQQLMSGEALGYHGDWQQGWNATPKQFMTNYAQYERGPSILYKNALKAVETANLCSGAKRASNIFASILSVMAQMPINARNKTYDFGNLIAKTDYSQILLMAVRDSKQSISAEKFLQALVLLINKYTDVPVNGDSPVMPPVANSPIDLSKVSLRAWVYSAMPKTVDRRPKAGDDKMSQQHYPGNDQEKVAMRTFGPYGKKTDPGERAIFELRSLASSPVADLEDLVTALATIVANIHH